MNAGVAAVSGGGGPVSPGVRSSTRAGNVIPDGGVTKTAGSSTRSAAAGIKTAQTVRQGGSGAEGAFSSVNVVSAASFAALAGVASRARNYAEVLGMDDGVGAQLVEARFVYTSFPDFGQLTLTFDKDVDQLATIEGVWGSLAMTADNNTWDIFDGQFPEPNYGPSIFFSCIRNKASGGDDVIETSGLSSVLITRSNGIPTQDTADFPVIVEL